MTHPFPNNINNLPIVKHRGEEWLFDEDNHQLITPFHPLKQEPLNIFAFNYFKAKVEKQIYRMKKRETKNEENHQNI